MTMQGDMQKEGSSSVAWGSLSDLDARPTYHISSEISIYIHNDYHSRGLGSLLLR
jgi:phosphinothricin acetyltransferase